MSWITPFGLVLSALALLLLGWSLLDWLRRVRSGAGGPGLRPLPVRWGWPALLVAAFVIGTLRGPAVLERVERSGSAASPAAGSGVAEATASFLRLPFYAEESTLQLGFDGRALPGGVRMIRLQVPWTFLIALLLYLLIVVRPSRRRIGPAP